MPLGGTTDATIDGTHRSPSQRAEHRTHSRRPEQDDDSEQDDDDSSHGDEGSDGAATEGAHEGQASSEDDSFADEAETRRSRAPRVYRTDVRFYKYGLTDYSKLPAQKGGYVAELDGRAAYYEGPMRLHLRNHDRSDHIGKYGRSGHGAGQTIQARLPTLRTENRSYLRGQPLRVHAVVYGCRPDHVEDLEKIMREKLAAWDLHVTAEDRSIKKEYLIWDRSDKRLILEACESSALEVNRMELDLVTRLAASKHAKAAEARAEAERLLGTTGYDRAHVRAQQLETTAARGDQLVEATARMVERVKAKITRTRERRARHQRGHGERPARVERARANFAARTQAAAEAARAVHRRELRPLAPRPPAPVASAPVPSAPVASAPVASAVAELTSFVNSLTDLPDDAEVNLSAGVARALGALAAAIMPNARHP